jgi:hypothetical protein
VIGNDYCPFVQVCKKQLELEFEIVGVAYDGPISEVRYQHPYVVIVDVNLLRGDGHSAGVQHTPDLPGSAHDQNPPVPLIARQGGRCGLCLDADHACGTR